MNWNTIITTPLLGYWLETEMYDSVDFRSREPTSTYWVSKARKVRIISTGWYGSMIHACRKVKFSSKQNLRNKSPWERDLSSQGIPDSELHHGPSRAMSPIASWSVCLGPTEYSRNPDMFCSLPVAVGYNAFLRLLSRIFLVITVLLLDIITSGNNDTRSRLHRYR